MMDKETSVSLRMRSKLPALLASLLVAGIAHAQLAQTAASRANLPRRRQSRNSMLIRLRHSPSKLPAGRASLPKPSSRT